MALYKNGSRGSGVTSLQNDLKAAGFDPGPIDGIYGPKTTAAVRAYQAANDLTVDGIAGPKTLGSFGTSGSTESEGDSEGNTEEDQGEGPRFSVPGGGELWKVNGEDWLVYTVPETEPPVYMAWSSPSEEDTQSFFGPDQPIVYSNEIGDWSETDYIDFGSTDDLANMDDNPFDSWSNDLDQLAQTQPWVLDDDYQRFAAMATLEGRPIREDELALTKWYSENTEAQREWMKLEHGDPMTAETIIEDNRAMARQSLIDAGITGFSDEMVNYMADKVTQGDWSETYFTTQVSAASDPSSNYPLDSGLTEYTASIGSTIEHEDDVRELANKWLGPAYSNWSDEEVAEWAGQIRNDPNGEQRLVENLKNQRMALFPEYEDRNLSYNDIASPWRNFAQSAWGQTPDETSDMFQQILRNNDSTVNGQLLRKTGMEQGIGKVMVDANAALLQGAGGSVRRPMQ